ncbi:hypothetical protein CBS101457_005076 [Exobasidium rhododendri]|nr:hypothetical protein CBS101457_005076 [Exobasidium rhododendri]
MLLSSQSWTTATPVASLDSNDGADQMSSRDLLDKRGATPCKDLGPTSYAEVQNPSKFKNVDVLSEKNGFKQGPYHLAIAKEPNMRTTIRLESTPDSRRSLAVFKFEKSNNPSSFIMFWLASGQSCQIPDGFIDLIDHESVQVLQKI